jgi:serine/threonine protein phosphatase 1
MIEIAYFEMNENGNRSFIIGDLHGCRDMLEKMLAIIPWDHERDNLIFVGDYIDRGDDSKGVIDILLKLTAMSPRVQCLMGNHESLFLDYLSGKDQHNFLINGGVATLNSYRLNGRIYIPPQHISFIESLKILIELDDYFVVHAGLMPEVRIEKQTIKDILWIREVFIFSEYDFGKKIIFGHTPFLSPFITDNKIGLDTGAVFGNKLTCVELPDEKFYYVGSK